VYGNKGTEAGTPESQYTGIKNRFLLYFSGIVGVDGILYHI
jgi:hypothetical protein